MAPLAVGEVRTSGLQREITLPGLGDRITLKDLAVMSRQMATMISAGLSLLRTLSILAEQTPSKPLAKVLAQTRSDVETGSALSDSLGRHRDVVPAADGQHDPRGRGRRVPRGGAAVRRGELRGRGQAAGHRSSPP